MTGERVRQLREAQQLTQRELADRVNMNHRSLSFLETGRSMANAQLVSRLARELNVSADYLVGLTDDPTPNWKGENTSRYSWLTALELNRLPPERQRLIYKVVVLAIANLDEVEKADQ